MRIFAGSEHPFGDWPFEPFVMPPRKVREMRPRARRALIRAQKKAEEQEQSAGYSGKGANSSGQRRKKTIQLRSEDPETSVFLPQVILSDVLRR